MNLHTIQLCSMWVLNALSDGDQMPDVNEMPSYGSLLLQTILALILVCVLAYVLLRYGLKWLIPKAKGQIQAMKIIDRLPLEGRRAVYLVEIGEKILILAATDSTINKVGELNSADLAKIAENKELENSETGTRTNKTLFQSVLDKLSNKSQSDRPTGKEKTNASGRGDRHLEDSEDLLYKTGDKNDRETSRDRSDDRASENVDNNKLP